MDPSLLAVSIVVVLFVLLFAGMPIGFAMGLSAFIGTLLLIDLQAALALLGPDGLRNRRHLQFVSRPDVCSDGIYRRRREAQRVAVPRLQCLARTQAWRLGTRDNRRLRRLCGDLRLEPRDSGGDGADRAARAAPLR